MFANALMLPLFDYLDIIWSKTFRYRLNELDILYKKVAKIALNIDIRVIIFRSVQENGMASFPSQETATYEFIYV